MLTKINDEVQEYIDRSVLCWLATSDADNFPNVSPKEMFLSQDEKHILIANIASPNSVKNIHANNKVCVSFIDVFVQKGYKVKGHASIIEQLDAEFNSIRDVFHEKFGSAYPIVSFIRIRIKEIRAIVAPSYHFYPEVTDEERMEGVLRNYRWR